MQQVACKTSSCLKPYWLANQKKKMREICLNVPEINIILPIQVASIENTLACGVVIAYYFKLNLVDNVMFRFFFSQ